MRPRSPAADESELNADLGGAAVITARARSMHAAAKKLSQSQRPSFPLNFPGAIAALAGSGRYTGRGELSVSDNQAVRGSRGQHDAACSRPPDRDASQLSTKASARSAMGFRRATGLAEKKFSPEDRDRARSITKPRWNSGALVCTRASRKCREAGWRQWVCRERLRIAEQNSLQVHKR